MTAPHTAIALRILPEVPGRGNLPPMIRMMMASRAEGFGAEVKRGSCLVRSLLSAGYADQYYNKALQVRRKIRSDFDSAFKRSMFCWDPLHRRRHSNWVSARQTH